MVHWISISIQDSFFDEITQNKQEIKWHRNNTISVQREITQIHILVLLVITITSATEKSTTQQREQLKS